MYKMGKIYALLLFLSIALVCTAGNEARAKEHSQPALKVNGIAIDVRGEEPVMPDILEHRKGKEIRTWVVQFDGPIREEDKKHVISSGCRLLDYLPDFAFLAVMDNATKESVEKLPFVTGVTRFKPAYKLHGKLREKAVTAPDGEEVRLHLKLDEAAHVRDVLPVVYRFNGHVSDMGRDTLRVVVTSRAIAELAALDEVTWIDEHLDMQLFNDTTRWVIQTNLPNDTKLWDNGLNGDGEVVGIGDTGLDYDMPWFRDPTGAPIGPGHRKIVGYDTTYGDDYDADSPGHGTHVSGTVAGDHAPVNGLSNANGMAPKARIFVQDLTAGASNYVNVPSDIALLFTTAYSTGARLHTNSWGNNDNTYGPYAACTDRFIWEHRDFLALFANGNNGPGSYTVGNPATAKNVISVGASYNGVNAENMAGFSSNGPTADDRIKPTVTAPGFAIVSADSDGTKGSYNGGTLSMSGTSMATPAVAGAAAMVRQYFSDGYYPHGMPSPGNAFSPSAALIKAVIINCARNMNGTGTAGPIPSTGQGWGRISLANALPFAGDAGGLAVADEDNGLQTGGSWSRQFIVPGGHPLKVTLVWSDYPGATGAAKAIVNDLDLTVGAPDGTILLGNAFAGGESVAGGAPDRRNVEEQILVKSPVAGLYTVTVTGYNVPYGPQPFAIAVTGASEATSKGTVSLDRQRYNSGGTLQIQLADRDMNSDPANVEQTAMRVSSSTEPTGETVTLTETAPNSAIFVGTLLLASPPAIRGDGRLQTAGGDTITAFYQDADDGSGKPATVTAVAIVDNAAPVISNLAIPAISDTAASFTWNTDEPANTMLTYSDSQGVNASLTDKRLTTQHSMSLAGLREGAAYHVTAASTDEAGNTASSGAPSFTTLRLPPILTASSSEGGTTYQPSTVISGSSMDPSGVTLVTVNGTPANYRPSDGYFNLPVELHVGDNSVSVTSTDSLGSTASVSLTVTRLQPSDLFVQSVAGPPAAVQGNTIAISDSVCNGGPGDASGFSIAFYLSGDQSLSAEDNFIGSRNVTSISAGTCSDGTIQGSIPTTAPGGPLYLLAVADYTSRVVEANENNNMLAGNQVTLPYQPLAAPASITVPASNTTGSLQVSWKGSTIAGASYALEMSTDGGAYTSVYTGTYTWANITVAASGTYTFRVKATRSGYADSGYSATANCVVTLVCGAPASINVPAGNSTGGISISWSGSNVTGVTYVLEASKDGSAYTTVYTGTYVWASIAVAASGTYTFRVKATRPGFTDSTYSPTASCVVTLLCVTPASITVPATNATGSFQVRWGGSTTAGATYVLEMNKDGGTYSSVYTGTYAWANITVAANGTYAFRVKATRAGFTDSAYSATASCAVTLACDAPASITVPATNTTGGFQVSWRGSTIAGVTYVLEMSKDGGAYSSVYTGTYAWANIAAAANGTYTFRVKATKPGYADSTYSPAASCGVTLLCVAPASITVPATNATGSFQARWGGSTIAGVTYVLEMSKDGGAYTPVYTGTYTWANIAVAANGTYTFRAKTTKPGYADSAYSVTARCVVTLVCDAPASIAVPATNATGSFQVTWARSTITGVGYVLEVSKDGGAYSSVYTGAYTWAYITGAANGTYIFRVKVVKPGYADSTWKVSSSVLVKRP